MLKSVQWDIYTILMVALVPLILLTAGGLYFWNDYSIHKTQCEMAEDWIRESGEMADQFQSYERMGQTEFWTSTFAELDHPRAAGTLRSGIIQSAEYHAKYYPDMEITERGALNPVNGRLERQIEKGTEDLIEHCPDTASLLPEAFPQIYREDSL